MAQDQNYVVFTSPKARVPVKAWVKDVPVEKEALEQAFSLAQLPFVYRHVALMPDVHAGIGSTIGSVIATQGAVPPACVGVDIGCGMCAVRTSLHADDLPDDLKPLRSGIEAQVPCGRSDRGGRNDVGAWRGRLPQQVAQTWNELRDRDEYTMLRAKHKGVIHDRASAQLGTLGTGNHFIEVCLDADGGVWVMLHSGSRGQGNRIGTYFTALAIKECKSQSLLEQLPHKDLAFLSEGQPGFDDYCKAVQWAQDYARLNRELMLARVLDALAIAVRPHAIDEVINCHHNYISKEHHFGEDVLVIRKGAVRARLGDLGIIPGSMGARSYIVRGLGNPESFMSCSHGAGRAMSRTRAKATFTVDDHARATQGVECRKDPAVIDETPMAYKSIDAVMAAQRDLVEPVYTLKQVVCVKG
ncbi:MAG: RtcB family protein [Candidatus Eremiobacteraeota bacterium]|nr:RtcB family protein [Candidatus Eremiobacteraeota bacterium]